MPRKLFVVVAVLMSAVIASVYAQTGARAKDPALQAAIEARQKAMDARNTAEWSKYTTDDFVLVSGTGTIDNRKVRMEALAANTNKPNPVVIDSVRMFGPDTAVTIQHGTGAVPNRITLIWVRQAGAWKVTAGQVTPITKK